MSRLLQSETLTLLILLAIAGLAGYVLGEGCKEILQNLVSGLLGWLAKGAVSSMSETPSTPIPEPSTSEPAGRQRTD